MRRAILFFCFFVFTTLLQAQMEIYVLAKQSRMENYAALELQRYLFQLTGELLPIKELSNTSNQLGGFILQTQNKNLSNGKVRKIENAEGYSLKSERNLLTITGGSEIGLLYGVYGLLEDYYGVGFYLGHDVIPAKRKLEIPLVDELKIPSMKVRGFLPWTNFPQSATVYSWEDWKFIIDQAAKMRMNFIHIHNYNGEAGHNEMFHNFTIKGITSRVWMPTAKTGHGWSCKGFEVKNFRFGAEDLFDDYDFGADCALHNETLGNELVFRKGVSLFQRVIEYAHTRGVKIGLGLDIDLIMPDYKTTADDPVVIKARMDQVMNDYPNLDYLILFISENILTQPEKIKLWQRTFDGMYQYSKSKSHQFKLAVAGWGLSQDLVAKLPNDVIVAPISKYSDEFDDGTMYGQREFWGCPWMERDFFSSEYYYPYNMHLSNTIKAWNARSKNMQGFYTLTWRLTDAIDPKISFIAKAPWDDKGKYKSSKDVYYEYASKNYGAQNAVPLTEIINENEPLSCSDAECQPTGLFTGKSLGTEQYQLNFHRIELQSPKGLRKIYAFKADSIASAGIEKRDDADSCIAWVQDGAVLKFGAVAMDDVSTIKWFAATANPFAGVQIFANSPNSKPIASFTSSVTGGWHNWKEQLVNLEPTKGTHDLYVVFKSTIREDEETRKTKNQLDVIRQAISRTVDKDQRRRLRYVQSRLTAADLHLKLNKQFPSITKPNLLTPVFENWTLNFINRVTDISSLGNVQSIQNRYVQERYLAKENELLNTATVKFPTHVQARGTTNGAVITWNNNQKTGKGFNVYANDVKVNAKLIPFSENGYEDNRSGAINYSVSVVDENEKESEQSPTSTCLAGAADNDAPLIVLISPPTSVWQGTKFSLKARLVDDRAYSFLSAFLHVRKVGRTTWELVAMKRKVKGSFTIDFDVPETGSYEYFVSAGDGRNQARYPVDTVNALSFVVEKNTCTKPHELAGFKSANDGVLWSEQAVGLEVFRVYRSNRKDFEVGSHNLVTYLPKEAKSFQDNLLDFDASELRGRYYYKIDKVDHRGCVIAVSPLTSIIYQ